MTNLILGGMFVAGAIVGGVSLWWFLNCMNDLSWGLDDEDFL